MINDYLLSIIIPVYNVELYLRECLLSILLQKRYFRLELILVDDGSVDSSGEICDEYSLNYSFIKVIHQSNGGLSAARNRGMKEAKGKYIWFVDSDDKIYENAFVEIFNVLLEGNIDIICFPYLAISGEKKEMLGSNNRPLAYKYMNMLAYMRKYKVYISACFQIIKRTILDNVSFIEGVLHEDHDFTLRLYYHADSILYIDTPLYLYFIRDRKSITSNLNVDNYRKRLNSLLVVLQKLLYSFPKGTEKGGKGYYIHCYIDNHINYILRLLYLAPLPYQEKMEYLRRMNLYSVFRINRKPQFLSLKHHVFDLLTRFKLVYIFFLSLKND